MAPVCFKEADESVIVRERRHVQGELLAPDRSDCPASPRDNPRSTSLPQGHESRIDCDRGVAGKDPKSDSGQEPLVATLDRRGATGAEVIGQPKSDGASHRSDTPEYLPCIPPKVARTRHFDENFDTPVPLALAYGHADTDFARSLP